MKVKSILSLPMVIVLLYLHEKGEVRYSELAKLIRSRGTLSLVLKEMDEEGLLERKVLTTRPVQVTYLLSQLGDGIASNFLLIKRKLDESKHK